ncbi:MAG TPA: Ig-like domain-containing protein [Longimicrobium sp.]|nr:Ig-like domain-containing protein [Longimicrobium sp.]
MRNSVRLPVLLCTLLTAALAGCASSTGPGKTAARLTLSPTAVTLGVAATRPVTVTAFDDDDKTIEADVRWTSSNATVAEVNDAGVIVARAPGSAVLTATMDDAQAQVTATVVPAQMTVCETNNATVCGAWVWQNDHYAGTWQDGATANITVTKFGATVEFARVDYGKNKDFTASYTGVVNLAAKSASGAVKWSITGQSATGNWTAQW